MATRVPRRTKPSEETEVVPAADPAPLAESAATEAEMLEQARAEVAKDADFEPSKGGWVARVSLYVFVAVVVLVVPSTREGFEVNIFT